MRNRLSPRSRSHSARKVETREERPRFLIVCEGEKTEPNYFRGFRVSSMDLEVVGEGDNTKRLVLIAQEKRAKSDYDQVWVVFDRDSFPAEHFNEAMQRARALGIRVAYSNEAFEIWYLLHFDFHQAGIERGRYAALLSSKLGRSYKKNDPSIFQVLLPHQETAIRHAAKLAAIYDPPRPERDNPSTTVHLLVAELRKFAV
jgi:hypothetical protein